MGAPDRCTVYGIAALFQSVSNIRAGSANRNLVSEPPRIDLYCSVNAY